MYYLLLEYNSTTYNYLIPILIIPTRNYMIPKPAAVQPFRIKLTNHTQYTEFADATTYKTKAHIKETVKWCNVQGIQRAVLGHPYI